MEYQTGDTILYGMEGVCRITGIDRRSVAGMRMDYYVLKPVYNEQSTVLVPMKNQKLTSKMHRLLSEEEIRGLIHTMPSGEPWEEQDSKRREEFKDILTHGTRRELIAMIRTLYRRQEKLHAAGKKLHVADERLLKDAESKLFQEFAHVLHIEEEQVLPFIREEMQQGTA